MLDDKDPWVRRVACEAIAHRGTETPVDALVGLLDDDDRFVAFAARRALQGIPADQLAGTESFRPSRIALFLQGATGLLGGRSVARHRTRSARPLRNDAPRQIADNESGRAAIARRMTRRPNIATFCGSRSSRCCAAKSRRKTRPASPSKSSKAYPTNDTLRQPRASEAARLLAAARSAHALSQQLASNIDNVEKLQIAAYAPRIKTGWQTDDKLAMLRYYESVRGMEGGHSVNGYIEGFARDFFTNLSLAERRQVLAAGENFPTSALSILAKLPDNPGADVLADIRALDERVANREGEPMARLRVGTVASWARAANRSRSPTCASVYQSQPERRAPIAASLAQFPDGENWDVLVDSLRSVDGMAAQEVLTALATVNRRPTTSEPYRNVILQGLRLRSNGGDLAVDAAQALDRPIARRQPVLGRRADRRLAKLVREQIPRRLARRAAARIDDQQMELSPSWPRSWKAPKAKSGNPTRGAKVFHDAQCVNCHRVERRRRKHRPRFDERRPALPTQGSPRVDRLSVASRLRSIRQPQPSSPMAALTSASPRRTPRETSRSCNPTASASELCRGRRRKHDGQRNSR